MKSRPAIVRPRGHSIARSSRLAGWGADGRPGNVVHLARRLTRTAVLGDVLHLAGWAVPLVAEFDPPRIQCVETYKFLLGSVARRTTDGSGAIVFQVRWRYAGRSSSAI